MPKSVNLWRLADATVLIGRRSDFSTQGDRLKGREGKNLTQPVLMTAIFRAVDLTKD
jgi:hypothetical protein